MGLFGLVAGGGVPAGGSQDEPEDDPGEAEDGCEGEGVAPAVAEAMGVTRSGVSAAPSEPPL